MATTPFLQINNSGPRDIKNLAQKQLLLLFQNLHVPTVSHHSGCHQKRDLACLFSPRIEHSLAGQGPPQAIFLSSSSKNLNNHRVAPV